MARTYDVVVPSRTEGERTREYVADSPLAPGDVVVLGDRLWLIDRIGPGEDGKHERAIAAPARYRFRLRHPDGREELGAFRRFRTGGPRLGHAFTTLDHAQSVSWTVVDELLAHDDGDPYLDLVAERDYGEFEQLPDHELEHALAAEDWSLSEAATSTMARAATAGLSVELVALEPGQAPDWEQGERYIDALVLEVLDDELPLLCGVDPELQPRETWIDTVTERLRADLAQFRADVEGDHDQIEEWDFQGGRVLAAVGSFDDESASLSGYGWLIRLVDSGALGAAGFHRVRRAARG